MKRLIALFLLLPLVAFGQLMPIQRNFFTTNPNPSVVTSAGSNVTVQATTTFNTRTFTVNGQTDTNVVNILATNVVSGTTIYGSNVVGAVSQATHATNADNSMYGTNATYVLTATLTNQVYATNVVSGGQLPIGTVATNAAFDGAFLRATNSGTARVWTKDGSTLTNLQSSALVGTLPIGLVATNTGWDGSFLTMTNSGTARVWTQDGSTLTNIPQTAITTGAYWNTNPAAASSISNALNVASKTLTLRSPVDADALAMIDFYAGSTGDYRRYLRWNTYTNSLTGFIGFNAYNAAIWYKDFGGRDNDAYHVLSAAGTNQGGVTWLNSAEAVYINYESTKTGTSGLSVWDGAPAGSNTRYGAIDSAGVQGLHGRPVMSYRNNDSDYVKIFASGGGSGYLTTTLPLLLQSSVDDVRIVDAAYNNNIMIGAGSGSISAKGTITATNGFTSYGGATIYGDNNRTNATRIDANGLVSSNANGSVTIAGGNTVNSGSVSPTNGVIFQGKHSFTTNFTMLNSINIYECNGTNQTITMLNTTNSTPWQIYRFASTNGHGKFTLQTAQADQTIRDGTSTTFVQVGIGSPSFYHDGKHWWSAARTRVVFPNACWSLTTNLLLTADVITNVPFNQLEFNNSQGIALVAPGKFYITNSGQYMITFSAVINGGGNNTSLSLWMRQSGVDVPRSRTRQVFTSATAQQCMTVNYIFNVSTNDTYFELYAGSHDTGAGIISEAANPTTYTAPVQPGVILTVNKVSDTYP